MRSGFDFPAVYQGMFLRDLELAEYGDFENVREIDDDAIKRLFGDTKPPIALTRDLTW